jgi:scyllo-inositol 2-dehydrogenase (NAD+)
MGCMSADRITAAVIGCGRMGAFTSQAMLQHAPACWHPLNHASAINLHPRLALAALCDVNPDMLAKAALEHGISAAYADAAVLLEEVKPSLLGIATRTIGRADLILDALAKGVRALHVEKPLCNSVAELGALRQAWDRPDVFVAYGTIRRFFSIFQQAKALALSGQYGALREIRVNLGSGQLFWSHPHAIDLILFGAGDRKVSGVQARLDGIVTGDSALDIVSDPVVVGASIYFEDGVAGHITQAHGFDFVLSCTDGEIAVKADGARIEILANRDGAIYPTSAVYDGVVDALGPEGTFLPVSQLAACLDGDAAAIASNRVVKQDILRGQQIVFAMLQSQLEGSRIVAADAADPAIFIQAQTGGRYA